MRKDLGTSGRKTEKVKMYKNTINQTFGKYFAKHVFFRLLPWLPSSDAWMVGTWEITDTS